LAFAEVGYFLVGIINSPAFYAQDGHKIVTTLQIFLNPKMQEILKNGFLRLKEELKNLMLIIVGTIFISQTQRKPFLSISCTLCLGMFVMW
jgi:hypothetical protein